MLKKCIILKLWFFLFLCNFLQAQQKPNIIFILADDLGYGDISAYGSKIVQTPNIDALANSGAKMINGYCTSPICSPSRAAMLTGRYQQRFGFEYQEKDAPIGRMTLLQKRKFLRRAKKEGDIIDLSRDSITVPNGLPANETTIAQLLQKHGYKTGVIGKWNLGVAKYQLPDAKGFDYFYGFYTAASLYAAKKDAGIIDKTTPSILDRPTWYREGLSAIRRNGTIIKEKEYLTYSIANEAVSFIEENKHAPFFLYVPFSAPHTPLQAPRELVKKFEDEPDPIKQVYYAMIVALDEAIGKIMDKVKKEGLEENTLIIFTSDNGGAVYTTATNNEPLKGGKMSEFDGGLKVPYIMSFPGRIPAGKMYGYPVSTLDIFATITASVDIEPGDEKKRDGVNIIPYLTGENASRPHEVLYWRNGYSKAVRKGDYKLYVNDKEKVTYLYDLSIDPGEYNDISAANPGKLQELKAELAAWEATLIKPMWKSRFHYRQKIRDRYYIFPT